jgi:neutral ceramidase
VGKRQPWQRRLQWSCAVLVLALSIQPLSAAAFRAGVAEVDITPPSGLPMYGYFERIKSGQVAAGTLDPLYARVLVLEAGAHRLALITLDLGRTFSQPWLDRLRTAVETTSHFDALIVTASHTHSGPNILDQYPDGRLPAWQLAALNKIQGAVARAAQNLTPARIGAGSGAAYISYNRRRVASDGAVTMLWSNPDKVPSTPLDPTLTVIRIDNLDGSPIAILIHFACHPVIFGPDNLQYSADYVGVALNAVASAFEHKPLCLFLQGADGDINPFYATTPWSKGALAKRDWTGQQVGNEAARVARTIQTRAPSSPSLELADDVLTSPLRWNAKEFRDGLLRVNGPGIFQDHADLLAASPPPSQFSLHVTTSLINREIAVAGMPGEPFVDFQIDLRDRCPVPTCMLLGYTNGYFDYFPTVPAASQGGYGAGDSDTYVAVGTGERMLNHALVRIHEMLGELRPVPESDEEAFRAR